jgi:hypothetical protein
VGKHINVQHASIRCYSHTDTRTARDDANRAANDASQGTLSHGCSVDLILKVSCVVGCFKQ